MNDSDTDVTSPTPDLRDSPLWHIAVHEAGHAVAMLEAGLKVVSIVHQVHYAKRRATR